MKIYELVGSNVAPLLSVCTEIYRSKGERFIV